MDSNFRAFWLTPLTRTILGYSLFCERREEIKTAFCYPSDLVNTKTTIPLRVGEERWIYTSTLRVSVYIHNYSSPPRGIVVYYSSMKPELLALYWAVTQTYRDLLIGSKFVYTDNNFLSYLQTTARLGEDDIRWAAYLAQLNFSMKRWRIQTLS